MTTIVYDLLARNLKQAMAAKSVSVSLLAKRSGVNAKTITKYLAGHRSSYLPHSKVVTKLEQTLGVSGLLSAKFALASIAPVATPSRAATPATPEPKVDGLRSVIALPGNTELCIIYGTNEKGVRERLKLCRPEAADEWMTHFHVEGYTDVKFWKDELDATLPVNYLALAPHEKALTLLVNRVLTKLATGTVLSCLNKTELDGLKGQFVAEMRQLIKK